MEYLSVIDALSPPIGTYAEALAWFDKLGTVIRESMEPLPSEA